MCSLRQQAETLDLILLYFTFTLEGVFRGTGTASVIAKRVSAPAPEPALCCIVDSRERCKKLGTPDTVAFPRGRVAPRVYPLLALFEGTEEPVLAEGNGEGGQTREDRFEER